MKTVSTLFAVFTLVFSLSAQETISISEFEHLNNTSWKGNLMYVNYSDGREVNLKTTMQIKIKGDKILMNTQYTNEPSANGSNTIRIREDGKNFGNEKIIKKSEENGTLKIVTAYDGMDGNKKASIEKIYLFGNTELSITKNVTFKDSGEKLTRNRFTYTKI